MKGVGSGLSESRHEAELDSVLLEEGLLVELAELHDIAHVDLVEGSQHGVRVLGLLQAGSDLETHAVHLDALFGPCSGDFLCVVRWRQFDSGSVDGLGVTNGSDRNGFDRCCWFRRRGWWTGSGSWWRRCGGLKIS